MPKRTQADSGPPNSPPFTQRQGMVLAFVHAFIQRRAMAPSFEEIAGHFGISSPSVNGMIKTLERRGLLSRAPGVARSLRVLVPAAQLPGGDFGPSSAPAPRAVAAASVQDAIGAAAIAVLDVLMPHLKSEGGQELVLEAARSVHSALLPLVGEAPAAGAAATVAAEAARWSADGRGTVVPQRIWVKRRR